MQVVSHFYSMCKKFDNYLKWKVVKPPTCSLDFPNTEHGNLRFHRENHLNRLTHVYIERD